MNLQERLRSLYVQHGTNYVQEAADRIDADEALMQRVLAALAGAEEIDTDMAVAIQALRKRLDIK